MLAGPPERWVRAQKGSSVALQGFLGLANSYTSTSTGLANSYKTYRALLIVTLTLARALLIVT